MPEHERKRYRRTIFGRRGKQARNREKKPRTNRERTNSAGARRAFFDADGELLIACPLKSYRRERYVVRQRRPRGRSRMNE